MVLDKGHKLFEVGQARPEAFKDLLVEFCTRLLHLSGEPVPPRDGCLDIVHRRPDYPLRVKVSLPFQMLRPSLMTGHMTPAAVTEETEPRAGATPYPTGVDVQLPFGRPSHDCLRVVGSVIVTAQRLGWRLCSRAFIRQLAWDQPSLRRSAPGEHQRRDQS